MERTFGERLKSAREDRGYTQKGFAEALGITPTRLNYWEKDKREPNFFQIKNILNVLNISFEDLCGISNHEKKSHIISDREYCVISAYRSQPAMQPAVDRLLGLNTESDSTEALKEQAERSGFTVPKDFDKIVERANAMSELLNQNQPVKK